jgi:hypothetical protein
MPPDELISSARAIMFRNLGFVYFQHLGPKPADYPYPYPYFVWAIFAANVDYYDPATIEPDRYVTDTSFRPISEVSTWTLSDGQSQLRQLAVATLREV